MRRLSAWAAGLAAVIVAVVLIVHAPPVRRAALRYAVGQLESRFGVRLEADRLDYNLATLRIGLAGVRVAADRTPDAPFFQADYVSTALSRAAFGGTLFLDDVTIRGGRVTIVRTSAGTNLPESRGTGGEPPALPIGHIGAPALRIDVRDEPDQVVIAVPSLSVDVARASGRISIDAPATVSRAAHATRITHLTTRATFDGRRVQLAAMSLQSSEADATLDGTLALLVKDSGLDLRVTGRGDLARAAAWGMAEDEAPRGRAAFAGRLSGPFGAPVADLQVSTPDLRWDQLALTNVSATVRATTDATDVADAHFDFARGTVLARARLVYGDGGASSVDGTWDGVDVSAAVAPFAARGAFLPSGVSGGNVKASGDLGDIDRWTLEAGVRISGGTNRARRFAMPGTSRVRLADGTWRVEGQHRFADATRAAFALRVRGDQVALARAPLSGTVAVEPSDVPRLLAALRAIDALTTDTTPLERGIVAADLSLAGTLTSPRIRGRARVENGRISGQDLGAIDVAGEYRVGPESYQVDATLAPSQAVADDARPLRGRFEGDFHGAGTLSQPRGTGTVRIVDAWWRDVEVGNADAHVELDGTAARVTASAPRFGASGTALTRLAAPYQTQADVLVDRLNVGLIAANVPSPTPLAGTASLTGHAEGPLQSWREGTATAEITQLDATAGTLPIRLDGPSRATYANELIRVERASVLVGETKVSASGSLPLTGSGTGSGSGSRSGTGSDPLTINAAGDVGDIASAIDATGIAKVPIVGGAGPVTLVARVDGSLAAPAIVADVNVGPAAFAVQGYPLITDVRVDAHIEDDVLQLRSASARYQEAQATASGAVPLAWFGASASPRTSTSPARLAARLTNVTPAVLDPLVDASSAEDLAGSMDVTIDLESPTARVEALRGEARIDRLDLRIADLPVTQRAPTRIVAESGFARIESWDWSGQGATLGVRGQVRLADLQAGIIADGSLDLRLLTPFVRGAGLTTAGRITPRLSVTGPLNQPRVDGDMTIEGVDVRLNDPRVVVSSLSGRVVLSRSSAHLMGLAASVNGGDLTGDGSIDYQAGDRITANLATAIRGMALEFPQGLRSELNADLSLDVIQDLSAPSTAAGLLSGNVTVVRGAYREPLAVIGGLLTAVRSRAVTGTAERSPLLDALTLDVHIVTDDDVVVNNNTARLALGGDLRLIGTVAAPALSGRADVREGGRIFLGRNTYEVKSGRIDFANPLTIQPDLSIELTTRAGGEDIDVTLSGTADSPSVALSSTNSELTPADLTALLVTGRRFDDLASADAALIGSTVLGNLSGDVLGFAGRAVGLDTLRLGGVDTQTETARRDPTAIATETDPTSRLTFGRSFGSNVDVTLSQSLRKGDAQTWIVDYLPSRQLLLRLVSNDEDLRTYEFRHFIDIGTPPRVRSANVSQPPAGRVIAVRVSGDLAFPEARVRGLLRLGQGDRFDFADWQDDRDRLEQFYRDQNRLLVRIGSSRSTEAGGVVLVYDIQAGPETQVVTSGATVPSAVVARIRDAWSASILDDFLLAEVRDLVTDALASDGYLQPRVMPQLTQAGEVRTLTVEIDPRTRTTDLRVAFTGADDQLLKDLEAWAQAPTRSRQAVRDPQAFAAAAVGYLQQRGFAAPVVRVGAAAFSGEQATVPVTVITGGAFAVAAIRFEGNTLPADRLTDVVDLESGEPIDPGRVNAARDRLVAFYRREGFPSPTVTVRQGAAVADGARELVFAIHQGSRQVIGEIDITGQGRIDRDVIERNLRLETSQPLRTDDLLQARRRLFDTGLFRRVDLTTEMAQPSAPGAATIPMVVRVTVEEWPALRLRYGVEAAEQRPEDDPTGRNVVPGLSADVTRRTLFGRAIATGAAMRYQQRDRLARIFLNAPTMLSLPIASSLTLERSRQEFAAATLVTNITGISWEQRARVASHLQLAYAYRFERNRTFDTARSSGPTPEFDVTVNVARVTGSAAWDTRNDASDPGRGSFLSSAFEWGPEAAGSDFRFVRELTQAYRFTPWKGVVFASAARAGVVVPLAHQDVILSERFYAGGARSVRGLAEDSLGEHDFFGPLGGRAMLILNQEVRFPMYRWVRGVGFVDAGNVFARPRDVSLGDLTASAGVGLRLVTPFAILRADYGRVLKTGEGRWTFGIGHAF